MIRQHVYKGVLKAILPLGFLMWDYHKQTILYVLFFIPDKYNQHIIIVKKRKAYYLWRIE